MKPSPRAGRLQALLLALPLALAACGGGGGDPVEHNNQGYQALGAKDSAGALDHFGKALAALQPSDPEYKRALMGSVQARVDLSPEGAKQAFLDFASAQPGQVAAGDYQKVGMQLSEKDLTQAIEVLDAGLKRFQDDEKLKTAMDKTVAKAQQAGDSGALDQLRGLGYLGGGD